MGLQTVEVFVIQLAREGRLDFFCITDPNTYLCAKDLNMTIKGLLAEIKADLHKYDDSGAIDTSSVYRWAEIALKRFGGVIAVMSEAVVKTSNKQAVLPSDFFDMLDAYRCEPLVCEIPGGDKAKADLQHEIGWVERTERGFRWDSCTECCKEEFEKTITEKIYIGSHEVRFHYHHPVRLSIGRGLRRDCAADKYRDKYDWDNYDITISGNTMYTGFDGFIYIIYRATPKDDDGLPYIPETALGYLEDYVETYIKMKIFENAAVNGLIQGAGDAYKLYAQQEPGKFARAMKELKMSMITLNDYRELAEDNRRRMLSHERMWPNAFDKYIKLV